MPVISVPVPLSDAHISALRACYRHAVRSYIPERREIGGALMAAVVQPVLVVTAKTAPALRLVALALAHDAGNALHFGPQSFFAPHAEAGRSLADALFAALSEVSR